MDAKTRADMTNRRDFPEGFFFLAGVVGGFIIQVLFNDSLSAMPGCLVLVLVG